MLKKEDTLRFKDLSRTAAPRTERLSEADMLRKQLKEVQKENQMLREEHLQLVSSFRLLSHDLRAPVRAITQLAEWIAEDAKGHLSGETLENMRMLRSRARRLGVMHKDLSAYVRCNDLFDEETSAFDLIDLVGKVWLKISAEMAPHQRFEFAVDIDEFARWPLSHPRVIEAVLDKLISNAIVHHDRNEGFISVTGRIDHERFRICVDDDGPGIPLHLHEQALAPMKTLRARDKGAGTGLGLSMVDRLIHLAEGKISMQYTFPTTSRGLRVLCEFPVLSGEEV